MIQGKVIGMHIAKRAFRVHYAIREILPYAEELERKGIKVIKLNIGDPVPYGFQPPKYFREALKRAVDEGYNGYAPSTGLDELKEEIAKKEKKYNGVEIRDPRNDILITQGLSEAIFTVIAATAEEGDEILLPGPSYPSYIAYTNFMGAKPVFYRCIEEEGWVPDLDDVRKKITDRTRLMVLINPNNPTGAVIREKYVKEMVNIAAEHDIPIVSDEIYDLIVFDGLKTPSAAAVAREHPVIGFNGFSKVFLLTGWRLGYIYFHDPEDKMKELREAITRIVRTRISANTVCQRAAALALKEEQTHIKPLVEELQKRRDIAYKLVRDTDGLYSTKPEGAFYIFPRIEYRDAWKNDKEFVIDLLKTEHILMVHGSGFGQYGEWHFRSVLLADKETLEEAFTRIGRFIKKRVRQ